VGGGVGGGGCVWKGWGGGGGGGGWGGVGGLGGGVGGVGVVWCGEGGGGGGVGWGGGGGGGGGCGGGCDGGFWPQPRHLNNRSLTENRPSPPSIQGGVAKLNRGPEATQAVPLRGRWSSYVNGLLVVQMRLSQL